MSGTETLRLLAKYREGLQDGLLTTVELTLLVWTLGLVFGAILGSSAARWRRSIGMSLRIAAFIMGSTPILVVLLWLHFPAQRLLGVVIEPFWTAVFALALVNALVVAEIVRPAIENIPAGMIEAARVAGLRPNDTWRWVVGPLALRRALPGLLFAQVSMLHATLFASLISVEEIFRVLQRINAVEYRPVELYSLLALLFMLVSAPLNALALAFAKHSRDVIEND